MPMDATQPPLAELPREFPIFPLSGALLLPGGRLPLNIFEPRYLALTEDALAEGRMFAMIQPNPLAPPARHGPPLYRVGCLGRLSSFSESEDGQRYLITLHGVIRFVVTEELPMRRGYRRVRGDFEAFAPDLLPPAPDAAPDADRESLLDALRAYFSHHGFQANWDAIGELDTPGLVTTLSMVCPFDVIEKQALLEALSPAARAEMLLAMLRIDTHSRQGGNGTPGRPMAS
jgi:Lon protease-like protein